MKGCKLSVTDDVDTVLALKNAEMNSNVSNQQKWQLVVLLMWVSGPVRARTRVIVSLTVRHQGYAFHHPDHVRFIKGQLFYCSYTEICLTTSYFRVNDHLFRVQNCPN